MQDLMPLLAAGCGLAVLSAAGVVWLRKPVPAAIALLVHSLALAGLYLVLSAQFVAVGQVMIYSGAVVVLFLFVVLLLPEGGRGQSIGRARELTAVIGGGLVLAGLAFVLAATEGVPAAPGVDDSVAAVGRSLMGPMLVPFELTALPLLLAIVAAVTLWRRQEQVKR
jgi:NADH-quinone oxidoreductase subunit J